MKKLIGRKIASGISPRTEAARILLVPDKFKGTLSAHGVCAALAKGWQSVRPQDSLEWLPMSDGGDGFGEVLGDLLQAQARRVQTVDAAHRPVRANWWWAERGRKAIIEAAGVVGLAMLPPGRFHPFQLDTYGLGRVIEKAADAGAVECLVGIGGSATNDGGFGLARALGWHFFQDDGVELEQWWQLTKLARVTPPARRPNIKITVAMDVRNPLLGPAGCARVYGPQKGLRGREIAFAERCLAQLLEVTAQATGFDHSGTPGAGAAGGLGYGLMTFAGAEARSGFDVFAEAARLEEHIGQADLVITGEGRIDRQSLMGKGAGQVMALCERRRVPCLAVAGSVAKGCAHRGDAIWTAALTDLASTAEAKRLPGKYLERLSANLARQAGKFLPGA